MPSCHLYSDSCNKMHVYFAVCQWFARLSNLKNGLEKHLYNKRINEKREIKNYISENKVINGVKKQNIRAGKQGNL